jgi:tRNA wybutosine-synthesizing protein 3
MTASLYHAKPLLSAAINSGFRESGVQSLKNLDDPNSCPMVAVRTAGLGLEAIIASVIQDSEELPGRLQHLVANDYGTMLLKLANKRFEANQQRIEKFRVFLREAMASETKKVQQSEAWESPEARRQRKRDQGLRDQEAVKAKLARDIDFKTLLSSEDDQGHLRLHPND